MSAVPVFAYARAFRRCISIRGVFRQPPSLSTDKVPAAEAHYVKADGIARSRHLDFPDERSSSHPGNGERSDVSVQQRATKRDPSYNRPWLSQNVAA